MKRFIVLMVAMFFASTVVFAAPHNINANLNDNHSNSSVKNSGNSSSHSTAVQGQQVNSSPSNTSSENSNQTSSPSNSTSSGNGNKAYAVAYPAISGEVGNSTGNAGSIFGNFTISNTEKYKQIEQIIQVIDAEISSGAVDKSVGQYMIDALNSKMVQTVKTQRVLGIFWETSGKNLSNLMGLLTWDSFWKDGKKQGGDMSTIMDTTETNSDVVDNSTTNSTKN